MAALLPLGPSVAPTAAESSLPPLEQRDYLVDASSDNFPPVNMLTPGGELTGFGRALADAVGEAVGREVRHRHANWGPALFDWLARGQADFIHNAAISPARDAEWDFTEPILQMDEVILVRRGQRDVEGVDDLQGKRIACAERHISAAWVEAQPGLACQYASTLLGALTLVVDRRADAVLAPREVAQYYLHGLHLEEELEVLDEPTRRLQWAMAVREGDTATLALLNDGLRRVRASGTYDTLYNEYFGARLFASYTNTQVVLVVALAVGVGLLLGAAAILLLTVGHLHRARDRATASEARFRSITEAAPDAIILSDADGIVHFWNPAAARIFGYTADEMLGRSYVEALLPEKRREAARQANREFGRTGRHPLAGHTPLFRGLRKDGAFVPLESHLTVVETAEQRLALSIVRDVSARLEAERALRESEARLRSIAESAQDAIVVTDADGRVTFWNPAAARIFGFSAAEMLGRLFYEHALAPHERAAAAERIRAIRATGRHPYEGTTHGLTGLRKDGTTVALEVASAALDAPGGGSVGVLRDITGRLAAQVALRESEAQLRSITDAAQDGIVVTDADARVVFWNPAAGRIFGYGAEEMLGRSVIERLIPSEEHDAARERYARLREGRGHPQAGRSVRVTRLRRDGSPFPAEVSVGALTLAGAPAVLALVRDISERTELEAQLRHAQKMEAVGQLAGGVAHDFNNMLTLIRGYTELTLHTHTHQPEAVEMLREVLQASESAQRLTQRLLAFSRRQVLQTQALDPNALVRDLLKMLRRLLGERIELDFVPANDVPPVKADPGQMEQVLINLLVNARDAMPDGGRIRILTRTVEADHGFRLSRPWADAPAYVCLQVCDAGCGMDEAVQAQIFDPFFTTKPTGKGTGLGLSVAYGIVAQHGGGIEVQSTPGVGTTFNVFLPATEAPAHRPDAPVAPTALHGDEGVLLAEDDPAVLALAQRVLEGAGYRVFAAGDGLEALGLFRAHTSAVHVAVLDVVMPNLNGSELHKHLQAIRPDLPVVFATGYAADLIDEQALAEAGRPVLHKPYSGTALLQAVRSTLDTPAPSAAGTRTHPA